jgi:hypothetical protein
MNKKTFEARNHCLKLDFEENSKSLIYSVRTYMFEKFGVWNIWDVLPYHYSMYYYDYIKPIFKPYGKRIRRAIPRRWADISHLIVRVNFEFIKTFYEEEYKADIVDWNATEHHKEFAEWLEKAYEYVSNTRPQLEKQLENAYPPTQPIEEMFERVPQEDGTTIMYMKDDGVPYEVKYKDVNLLEAEISKRDTKVLIELAKRRDYFWT